MKFSPLDYSDEQTHNAYTVRTDNGVTIGAIELNDDDNWVAFRFTIYCVECDVHCEEWTLEDSCEHQFRTIFGVGKTRNAAAAFLPSPS